MGNTADTKTTAADPIADIENALYKALTLAASVRGLVASIIGERPEANSSREILNNAGVIYDLAHYADRVRTELQAASKDIQRLYAEVPRLAGNQRQAGSAIYARCEKRQPNVQPFSLKARPDIAAFMSMGDGKGVGI
jgi:hypothetical protein